MFPNIYIYIYLLLNVTATQRLKRYNQFQLSEIIRKGHKMTIDKNIGQSSVKYTT